MSGRLRHPAGSPEGGRFATAECPRVYALLDTLAASAEEAEEERDKPWRVAVPAPRCPHGHFARWAARNCCA